MKKVSRNQTTSTSYNRAKLDEAFLFCAKSNNVFFPLSFLCDLTKIDDDLLLSIMDARPES